MPFSIYKSPDINEALDMKFRLISWVRGMSKEQDRMQRYLDIAGVMIVIIDADQKVSLINKKGCEVLGYKENEIIGKNWFDHFLPERFRVEVKEVFNSLMAGNIQPNEYYENPILTKNNEERVIAWQNTVIKDNKGNIISILSSGEDITERKQTEDNLKESEKRLRTILNSLPDMIVQVDTNMRILWANKAALNMRPGAFGQLCYKVYTGKDEPCIGCPCKRP